MGTYIAVDIGASSGRLMLSKKDRFGQLSLEEVHRFKNGFTKTCGYDRWDIHHLTQEILIGLHKVKQLGIEECYVGIDTWGVDYCLLNEEDELLALPISYRDERTAQAVDLFNQQMTVEDLYKRTGIQLQSFNTIFQLVAEERDILNKAKKLLLIPDYLGFVFTGNQVFEKTNASTTQLMNTKTKKIDTTILSLLDLEEHLFADLVEPGAILGHIQKEKFPTYDLPEATFISVASHDTASAIVGTPGKGDDWAYISSGTWSLMGLEQSESITTTGAFEANFTNEWGVQGTIRFLKNIMGMWLIQEVAREQEYRYSYAQLAQLASEENGFTRIIDVNDQRFLNPVSMITEIQEYCRETGQEVPRTAGELARCIYDSLAICYAVELAKMEQITGKTIKKLHIVGGGSNNTFLNQLTADTCGIPVLAGPGEATAIGNIIVQMVATSGFGTLEEGREAIERSFELHSYLPNEKPQQAIEKYHALTKQFA